LDKVFSNWLRVFRSFCSLSLMFSQSRHSWQRGLSFGTLLFGTFVLHS
jgi:hypothetical protein